MLRLGRFAFALVAAFMVGTAAAADMVVKKSAFDVKTTLDRMESALKEKGITIVARWDHAAAAEKADMKLRPTEVLIFGNPQLGTPLMQSNQKVGVALPLKVLAWQDEKGQTWLGYVAPQTLAKRYNIRDQKAVIEKMSKALQQFTDHATKATP